MAEGGEPDDQRNQFSFQNFLKSSQFESGKNEDNDINVSRGETVFKPDLGIQPRRDVFKTDEGKGCNWMSVCVTFHSCLSDVKLLFIQIKAQSEKKILFHFVSF